MIDKNLLKYHSTFSVIFHGPVMLLKKTGVNSSILLQGVICDFISNIFV